MRHLNSETVRLLFSILSRRPLVVTGKSWGDAETHKQLIVTTETAIQRWIRSELFPAIVHTCPDAVVSGLLLVAFDWFTIVPKCYTNYETPRVCIHLTLFSLHVQSL